MRARPTATSRRREERTTATTTATSANKNRSYTSRGIRRLRGRIVICAAFFFVTLVIMMYAVRKTHAERKTIFIAEFDGGEGDDGEGDDGKGDDGKGDDGEGDDFAAEPTDEPTKILPILSAMCSNEPALNDEQPAGDTSFAIRRGKKALQEGVQATKKKKQRFVAIHVGPIKTGTTTIQKDSGQDSNFTKALREDGVVYVGKFSKGESVHYEEAIECAKKVIRLIEKKSDDIGIGVNSVSSSTCEKTRQLVRTKCWERYLDKSLVLSDEWYSSTKDDFFEQELHNLIRVFVDYLGYDEIVIVGAYRRYFDWMGSAYKQRAKNMCLHQVEEHCENVWEYVKRFVDSHKYSTISCLNLDETLLPFITAAKTNWKDEIKSQEEEAEKNMIISAWGSNVETTVATNTTLFRNNDGGRESSSSSKIKFDILNYFQLPKETHYNDVTTELYCKSLGMDRTPHACQYHNSSQDKGSINNKGSLDMVMYHDIIVEARNRGWVSNITYYVDETVEEANSNQRITQVKELERYHTATLGLSGRKNFPLLCPTRTELEMFLEKSLQFEKLILPGFFATDLGEVNHKRKFWELTETKKAFCWLDVHRLFRNAYSWNDLLTKRLVIDKW